MTRDRTRALLAVAVLSVLAAAVAAESLFEGAVRDEAPPSTADVWPPLMGSAFTPSQCRRILRAIADDADTDEELPPEPDDELLIAPRTQFLYHDSHDGHLTGRWAHEEGVEVHGVLSHAVTQYMLSAGASASGVTDPSRAWPYYFLSPRVLAVEPRVMHTRVYKGVVDVDVEAMRVLQGDTAPAWGGPAAEAREALVLVYNDWDDRASAHLALLEQFATMHTGARGVGLYERVNLTELPPSVARLLRRRGWAGSALLEAVPDSFYRLLQTASPSPEADRVDGRDGDGVGDAGEPATSEPQFILWLAGELRRRGAADLRQPPPHPAARGVTQLIAALRLAGQSADEESTTMAAALPGADFVLYGHQGMAQAPRLRSRSAGLTVADLRRFVIRHSLSSVFLHSYAQAASLVNDFGRVALLTLPAVYVQRLYETTTAQGEVASLYLTIARLPVVAGLRRLLPFFALVPPPGTVAPGTWPAAATSETLDLAQLISPLTSGAASEAAVRQRALESGLVATLSLLETPQPRRQGVGEEADMGLWQRHDILVPLPGLSADQAALGAHEMLVGSLLVDTVAARERSRVVLEVEGVSFQAALARLRASHPRGAVEPDVLVVLERARAPPTDETVVVSQRHCADRIRAHALRRAPSSLDARYMTVAPQEVELLAELLHAAWPLTEAAAAGMCAAATAGVDLTGCTLLCVPRGGRELYRLTPTLAHDPPPALLRQPPAQALVDALAELQASGAATSTWRVTPAAQPPWRLIFPADVAAPVVEYNLSAAPHVHTEGVTFTLVTDATCALCATPTKVFRVLRRCLSQPPVAARLARALAFHEVDVRALSYAPASEVAAMAADPEALPPLVRGLHGRVADAAGAAWAPPQFILQRGPRVLVTLPTNAYYQRSPWPRAVLALLAALFDSNEETLSAFAEVLSCVDATAAEEAARRAPMRRGVVAVEQSMTEGAAEQRHGR